MAAAEGLAAGERGLTNSMQAVVQGALAGGLVGAAVAYALRPGEKATESSTADVGAYKHLATDGALTALLQEPLLVFTPLDGAATDALLRAFDDLARIYGLCRQGGTSPVLMAEALKAKRAGSAHLAALTRKARQQRPGAASEILSDLEQLKQSFSNYVHNIDQEQALQRCG